MSQYGVSAVICCRWEETTIREWLIYHAALGIEHVFLYCNDDDPQAMFDACLPFMSGPSPFVTFTHWIEQGQQREMYRNFLEKSRHLTDWFIFIDADEFIYIHDRSKIQDWIGGFSSKPDVIYLNWLMFGNSGHVERPLGLVLSNYTQHENNFHAYTKVFVNTRIVKDEQVESMQSAFWHDWPTYNGEQIHKINVLGEPMDTYYVNFPVNAVEYIFRPDVKAAIRSSAFICHFALKSEHDFERRVARGLKGNFSAQIMWQEKKESGDFRETLRNMNTETFEELRKLVPSIFGWKSV